MNKQVSTNPIYTKVGKGLARGYMQGDWKVETNYDDVEKLVKIDKLTVVAMVSDSTAEELSALSATMGFAELRLIYNQFKRETPRFKTMAVLENTRVYEYTRGSMNPIFPGWITYEHAPNKEDHSTIIVSGNTVTATLYLCQQADCKEVVQVYADDVQYLHDAYKRDEQDYRKQQKRREEYMLAEEKAKEVKVKTEEKHRTILRRVVAGTLTIFLFLVIAYFCL